MKIEDAFRNIQKIKNFKQMRTPSQEIGEN